MTGPHERDELLLSFLHGRFAPSVDEARALLERLQAQALIDEAEQAAHGIRHLTVEHGDLESADDERRLHQLWQWAGEHRDRGLISTRGGNDSTTWLIGGGPNADAMLAELEALARRLDPGWWRIHRSAR